LNKLPRITIVGFSVVGAVLVASNAMAETEFQNTIEASTIKCAVIADAHSDTYQGPESAHLKAFKRVACSDGVFSSEMDSSSNNGEAGSAGSAGRQGR
jgi:hypothetical protein